mgnify:CR=1 FL=1
MTDDREDFDNPLEESALDLGEMRVMSIRPNTLDADPTFAFIALIEPDEDPETTDPSVLVADIEWAEGLQLATRNNPVFDFNNVPERSIVPMLWHPGPAMETSGMTYNEHYRQMTDRVRALAFFGDWDFIRVALQWERYRGPMGVVLYPEKFHRALMMMFRNEDVRDHVQDMMDRAEDYDDDDTDA